MSTQVLPLLTVDDLESMPEDGNRYEVIEGELFVSKAPSLTHQDVVANLLVIFRTFLRKNSIGRVWIGPGIIFSRISGVIPDIVYVSNARLKEVASGDRIEGTPDLVIEIVSPGTENKRRDRIVKRHLYGKYGVREYWVVDPGKRNVEMYTLHKNTLTLQRTFGETEKLVSSVLPGFKCKVESIFVI